VKVVFDVYVFLLGEVIVVNEVFCELIGGNG